MEYSSALYFRVYLLIDSSDRSAWNHSCGADHCMSVHHRCSKPPKNGCSRSSAKTMARSPKTCSTKTKTSLTSRTLHHSIKPAKTRITAPRKHIRPESAFRSRPAAGDHAHSRNSPRYRTMRRFTRRMGRYCCSRHWRRQVIWWTNG